MRLGFFLSCASFSAWQFSCFSFCYITIENKTLHIHFHTKINLKEKTICLLQIKTYENFSFNSATKSFIVGFCGAAGVACNFDCRRVFIFQIETLISKRSTCLSNFYDMIRIWIFCPMKLL